MTWNSIFMDGVWWVEWVWAGTWKVLALKVGMTNIYLHDDYYLAVWICLVRVNA